MISDRKMSQIADLAVFVKKYGLQCAIIKFSSNQYSKGDENEIIQDDINYYKCTGISSLITKGYHQGHHLPVLDIDMDCVLVDSSTPGHHHLVINKPMSEHSYLKLLKVLSEYGIVQPGYAKFSNLRKKSWIRAPWVKKSKGYSL